jgi:hypothetical protein
MYGDDPRPTMRVLAAPKRRRLYSWMPRLRQAAAALSYEVEPQARPLSAGHLATCSGVASFTPGISWFGGVVGTAG